MVDLIKLDYAYDALEPVIDKETMEIHHSKHHQAYVNKYNEAVKDTEFETMDIHEVVENLDKLPENIAGAVRNNGGGVINHNMFFTSLVPHGKEASNADFLEDVQDAFGSMTELISELQNAGATRFGSGWSWLVLDQDCLRVVSTPNQDNPISQGMVPLFGIDVWEHAYYLKYQNKRPEYLSEIFKVVDWSVVEKRYLASK